jgi:hypothetical protein
MIQNFARVKPGIFRGGAPSIKDVEMLKHKYGIKKIISLDEISGSRISRACKLLGIKHIMLPITVGKKASLVRFLSQDIPKLFDDGPTFIHCRAGKDRTGLAIALYRIEEDGWSCGKALKEAKKFGFGIGVGPGVVRMYMKIMKDACGCKEKVKQDVNNAYDIVSNERDEPGIYGSSDYESQLSWSPLEDYRTRAYPYGKIDQGFPEQYQSRQDYGLDDSSLNDDRENNEMPGVGQYDQNTQGINGAGPSMVGGGFI